MLLLIFHRSLSDQEPILLLHLANLWLDFINLILLDFKINYHHYIII